MQVLREYSELVEMRKDLEKFSYIGASPNDENENQ